jgi:hypothetical protein
MEVKNSCTEWYQVPNPLEPPPNKKQKIKEKKKKGPCPRKIVQSRRAEKKKVKRETFMGRSCGNAGH